MDRFQSFAHRHPGWFSLFVTGMVLAVYFVAGILAALLTSDAVANNLVQSLGRWLGAIVFAIIIYRFGWQEISGLSRLGSPLPWFVGLGILAYEIVTHVLPLAGELSPGSEAFLDTASVALNALATGPLEEIPFRGLILIAFIRLWAFADRGIVKCVIVASLFFGASHLVHLLLGRPLPQATAIALNAFLAGIYYSAILLRWKTIWPIIALHGLLNALVAIVAFQTPGFQEPADELFLAALLQFPLVIFAFWIILRIRPEDIFT